MQTTPKQNYERLEFLGDRVLNLLVARYLFEKYPVSLEGELTKRMGFASNDNLEEVLNGLDAELKTNFLTFKRNFIPDATTLTADDLEAFVGEYFLKHDWKMTENNFQEIFPEKINGYDPNKNYIGRLKERFEREHKAVPYYEPKKKEGPDHQPTFYFQVKIAGESYGEGKGRTQAEARKNAAFAALVRLGEEIDR